MLFLFLLPQLVELCNLISMSFLMWMMNAAGGDLSPPLGAINWATQPLAWGMFILIHFLVTLLFVFVQIVRLAVLDVCILLSPLWIVCLSHEYTASWGRLGATTFFAALLVQPLQIMVISFGAALITNVGRINPSAPESCRHLPEHIRATCISQLGNAPISASTPIALALGIATMYVAMKLPGMFFGQAVRASIGSVNRDVSNGIKSMVSGVMSVVMFNRHLARQSARRKQHDASDSCHWKSCHRTGRSRDAHRPARHGGSAHCAG